MREMERDDFQGPGGAGQGGGRRRGRGAVLGSVPAAPGGTQSCPHRPCPGHGVTQLSRSFQWGFLSPSLETEQGMVPHHTRAAGKCSSVPGGGREAALIHFCILKVSNYPEPYLRAGADPGLCLCPWCAQQLGVLDRTGHLRGQKPFPGGAGMFQELQGWVGVTAQLLVSQSLISLWELEKLGISY